MNAYELKDKLNEYYPFSTVDEIAKSGYVDNSGVICEGESDKICFTLDLTDNALDYAIKNGCFLMVTHHPVIFTSVRSVKGALARAIKNGVGIVSVHLPADYAPKGVDYYLAETLGAKNAKVLEKLENGSAYGRLFEIERSTLSAFAESVYKKLGCVNLSVFGESDEIKKVVSFCGAGLDEESLTLAKDADVIVSADVKHHVILQLVTQGKCLVMPTHYATENYGFKKISQDMQKVLKEKIYYYEENTLL